MSTMAELQSFSSVPKLETNGSNWIIFQIRLKWALEEKQVFGHLAGTTKKPASTEPAEKQEEWQTSSNFFTMLLLRKCRPPLPRNSLLRAVTSWPLDKLRFKYSSSESVSPFHLPIMRPASLARCLLTISATYPLLRHPPVHLLLPQHW